MYESNLTCNFFLFQNRNKENPISLPIHRLWEFRIKNYKLIPLMYQLCSTPYEWDGDEGCLSTLTSDIVFCWIRLRINRLLKGAAEYETGTQIQFFLFSFHAIIREGIHFEFNVYARTEQTYNFMLLVISIYSFFLHSTNMLWYKLAFRNILNICVEHGIFCQI